MGPRGDARRRRAGGARLPSGRRSSPCRSRARAAGSTTRRWRGSRARRSAPRPTPRASRSSCATGLRPWQARKIYQGGVGGYGEVPGTPVHVPTGVYDPVLGMTWQQLGSRARAMHRCQGAGPARRRPRAGGGGLQPRRRGAGGRAASETDILDGVDTSLAGLRPLRPGAGRSRRSSPRSSRRPAPPARPSIPRRPRGPCRRSPRPSRAVRALARSLDGTRGRSRSRAPRSPSACATRRRTSRPRSRSPRASSSRRGPTTGS